MQPGVNMFTVSVGASLFLDTDGPVVNYYDK